MDLSVLLATCRRPDLLGQTLDSFRSLRTEGLAFEILVVDNAGDPATREVTARAAPTLPVRLLVETARGQNRARNRAIPEARGALVAFTDDDVLADPDWLAEIVRGARRWPEHAVFGGRVLPRWPAGQGPPFQHAFMRHAYAIADWERPEGPYPAGYVFSPNMAIRASVFRAGWRFNPDLGPDGSERYMSGSETELLRRLEAAGLGAVYLPRAVVLHQIRPEQLRVEWLYGRAFRKGRSDATKAGAPDGSRLWGVPRPLLAQALRAYIRFLASRVSSDRLARFDRGVSYWRARGMMFQCRRARHSRHAPGIRGAT